MVAVRIRWLALLALALMGTPAVVEAQTAAQTGIIVGSDGRCIDVAGTFTTGQAPPPGTRVTLAACDGRPSQRWTAVMGDYNLIRGIGGACIFRGPTRAAELVVRPCTTDGDVHMIPPDRLMAGSACVTALPSSGASTFALAPCDGSPGQHWRIQ